MSKTKVLAFLDNPHGRDTEIVLPVTYCIEKYSDCEVTILFIWDLLKIKLINPDVVLLPNVRGHHMYVEIAEFCTKHSITVLALDSEGNLRTDGQFTYWGLNHKRRLFQVLVTCWSERVRQYLINNKVAAPEKVVVTGATGFDRYIVENKTDRSSFLAKYNSSRYSKVIGYAGWSFGKIFGRERSYAMLHIDKDFEKANQWADEQRIHVREILRELVEKNQDVLFIFKKHPKELYEDDIVETPNEMNELLDYPNVLYFQKEEDIKTLIEVSDIWMGFETTTLLEAWLLGKETIIINKEVEFPRAKLHHGSIIDKSFAEVQAHVDEFFEKEQMVDFHREPLPTKRKQLVSESIMYADGLNHLRAYYYFEPYLKKKSSAKKIPLNLRHLRLSILMNLGRFFYLPRLFKVLPGFRKSIYVFENRGLPGMEERKKELYAALEAFHKKKGITELVASKDRNSLRSILGIA